MTATAPDAEVGTALAQEGARAGVTMLELRYGLAVLCDPNEIYLIR